MTAMSQDTGDKKTLLLGLSMAISLLVGLLGGNFMLGILTQIVALLVLAAIFGGSYREQD